MPDFCEHVESPPCPRGCTGWHQPSQTSNALAVRQQPTQAQLGPVQVPAAAWEALQQTLTSGRADATWRAYRQGWNDWARWATAHNVCPMPADPLMLALWMTESHRRGIKVATLEKWRTGISQLHQLKGINPSPTSGLPVREALKGLRRARAEPPNRKAAAAGDELTAMLATIPMTTLKGLRDRAMLLVGFSAALRRSELVTLQLGDLRWQTGTGDGDSGGVSIYIAKSKTDQEKKGVWVGLARSADPVLCPVNALLLWLRSAAVNKGMIFRGLTRHGTVRDAAVSGRYVAELVKSAAAAAGLNPAIFSGHSLRAGYVTEGYLREVPEDKMQTQGRWSSRQMMMRYKRVTDPIKAGAQLDLSIGKKKEKK